MLKKLFLWLSRKHLDRAITGVCCFLKSKELQVDVNRDTNQCTMTYQVDCTHLCTHLNDVCTHLCTHLSVYMYTLECVQINVQVCTIFVHI